MAKNRFPRGDQEFNAAIKEFFKFVDNNKVMLGFSAAKVTGFDAEIAAFNAALTAKQSADNAAQAATADKNSKRETVEDAANQMAGQMSVNENVTAAMLEEAGLNAPDTTPTAVGVPETRPIGQVDTGQRLEHRVEFVDETSTTTGSRAKPEGVRGCQIWAKIGGAPPVDIKECQFLAEDSRSPYTANYTGADAGKTVYYILRWANTKGETGPISETVTATVTG